MTTRHLFALPAALAGFALETSDVTMDVMLYGLLLASSAAPWTAWPPPQFPQLLLEFLGPLFSFLQFFIGVQINSIVFQRLHLIFLF